MLHFYRKRKALIGQAIVEYIIIVGVVGAALIVGIPLISDALRDDTAKSAKEIAGMAADRFAPSTINPDQIAATNLPAGTGYTPATNYLPSGPTPGGGGAATSKSSKPKVTTGRSSKNSKAYSSKKSGSVAKSSAKPGTASSTAGTPRGLSSAPGTASSAAVSAVKSSVAASKSSLVASSAAGSSAAACTLPGPISPKPGTGMVITPRGGVGSGAGPSCSRPSSAAASVTPSSAASSSAASRAGVPVECTTENYRILLSELRDERTVPAQYRNHVQWNDLLVDPAHGGVVGPGQRIEAMATIQAMVDGTIVGATKTGTTGEIEFLDAAGQPWDVKAPVSGWARSGRPLTQAQADAKNRSGDTLCGQVHTFLAGEHDYRSIFNPVTAATSIQNQLRATFNGQRVNVLLDISFLTAADLQTLMADPTIAAAAANGSLITVRHALPAFP